MSNCSSPDFDGPHFDRDLFTVPGRLARLHKGAKPPKADPKRVALENAALEAQIAASKQKIEMPEIAVPPPAPPDPPPPGQTSSDVTDAERAARAAAGKRKGIKSTLLSVGTGADPSAALGGKKTLLG